MANWLSSALGAVFGDADEGPKLDRSTLPAGANPSRDQQVGQTELGETVYKMPTGQTYHIRVEEGNTAGALRNAAAATADFIEEPSVEKIKDGAVAAAQGTYDAVVAGVTAPARAARGEMVTNSDVADTVGVMVGGSGLGSKPAGSTGMFLREGHPGQDNAALKRAKDRIAAGEDRVKVWEEEGWGQFGKEWVREISDHDAHVMGSKQQQKPTGNPPSPPVPERVEMSRGQSHMIRTAYRQEIDAIAAKMRKGEISREEATKKIKHLEKEMLDVLNPNPTAPEKPASKPAGPSMGPTKRRGKLSEVLEHPELFAILPKTANTSAQVGYQSSAKFFPGPGTTMGAHYPNGSPHPELDDVNVFKEANVDMKTGKKMGALGLRDVTLHEVMHLVDKELGSDQSGYNPDRAQGLKHRADRALTKQRLDFQYSDEMEAVLKPALEILPNSIRSTTIRETLLGLNSMSLRRRKHGKEMDAEDIETRLRVNLAYDGPENAKLAKKLAGSEEFKRFLDAAEAIETSPIAKVAGRGAHQTYEREWGEAKARLVQTRKDLTPEERSKRDPWSDLDVPEDELFNVAEMQEWLKSQGY